MAQRRHVWYSPWLLKSQAIVSPVENSSPTVQALHEHGALRASPAFWVSWRPPTDSLARLGATGAFFWERQHTTPTQRPSHPRNCCALNFAMLSCWLSFGRFGQTKLLRESSSVFFWYRPITYHPFSVPLVHPVLLPKTKVGTKSRWKMHEVSHWKGDLKTPYFCNFEFGEEWWRNLP